MIAGELSLPQICVSSKVISTIALHDRLAHALRLATQVSGGLRCCVAKARITRSNSLHRDHMRLGVPGLKDCCMSFAYVS